MRIVLADTDQSLRLQLPVGMAGGSILATAHTVETTAEAAGEAGLVAARPTVKGTLKLARKRGYTATSTPLEPLLPWVINEYENYGSREGHSMELSMSVNRQRLDPQGRPLGLLKYDFGMGLGPRCSAEPAPASRQSSAFSQLDLFNVAGGKPVTCFIVLHSTMLEDVLHAKSCPVPAEYSAGTGNQFVASFSAKVFENLKQHHRAQEAIALDPSQVAKKFKKSWRARLSKRRRRKTVVLGQSATASGAVTWAMTRQHRLIVSSYDELFTASRSTDAAVVLQRPTSIIIR